MLRRRRHWRPNRGGGRGLLTWPCSIRRLHDDALRDQYKVEKPKGAPLTRGEGGAICEKTVEGGLLIFVHQRVFAASAAQALSIDELVN